MVNLHSKQKLRVISSVGLERMLDRHEVSSSNLLSPTIRDVAQLG